MIKKILRVNLFLLIIMGQMVFAQQDDLYEMHITQTDGKIDTIVVKTIDNIKFSKLKCIDRDGNEYKTVMIGNQIWMAENLKTTTYNDGTTMIPIVEDNTAWSNLSTGAYCAYNNDTTNAKIYGYLYNWYAVDTGKLAPKGWHVPTDAELTELNDYLAANGHPGTEGTALKSTAGWDVGNGTDNYGFTGLPSGYRNNYGNYSSMDYYTNFWSATEFNVSSSSSAWDRYLGYGNPKFDRAYGNKKYGYSVRFVRDPE